MSIAERKAKEILRLKAEGIVPESIIVKSGRIIAVVSPATLNYIVAKRFDRVLLGRFLTVERGSYCKLYNRESRKTEIFWTKWGNTYTAVKSAECAIEMFYNESIAIKYLTCRYTDTHTLHIRDAKIYTRKHPGEPIRIRQEPII